MDEDIVVVRLRYPDSWKPFFEMSLPSAESTSSARYARKRKARLQQATPPWANQDAIAKIYLEARRLTNRARARSRRRGVSRMRIQFVVDHVIPLQGRMVCGLHVEGNLRVVPASVNARKHNFYDTGQAD